MKFSIKMNKTTPSARAAYTKLSNQMFLKLATRKNIRQLLADFIIDTADSEFDEKFLKLLKSPKIQSAFTAFSKRLDEFSNSGFSIGAPIARVLRVYKYLIEVNSAVLNKFIVARDRIEHSMVIGDYGAAQSEIQDLENDSGESIWTIRTKMLILSAINDNEAFKSFCDFSQSQSESSLNSFIFKASQLIADAGSATAQLGAVVHRQIAEFQEAKLDVLSSFLQVLFNPFPLVEEIDHLSCIPYLQNYPIIDLYTILSSVIRIDLSNYDNPSDLRTELQIFAEGISRTIDDPILYKILKIKEIVEEGPVPLSGIALRVYTGYKLGQYEAAIKDYLLCSELGDSGLSLANLAAKSIAYLNDQVNPSLGGSVLDNLAKDLSTIYKLSPLWSQAEEQITSICIKYNHLAISPCLQLSLLKALPFRYSKVQQRLSARMAIASINSTTPKTFILATEKDLDLEEIDLLADVPEHRRVKERLVRRLSSDSINVESLRAQLDYLSHSEALHKDVLESYVTFYMKIGDDAELMKLAATELTFNSNHHICIPMEHLIEVIEREQLCDLDAVILCYHYSASISDKKDALLNETFEEYLTSMGASKPSQLLQQIGFPDLKQQFFFREICIPDIIDYLGCFTGSNGLRSERIIILDQLQKLGMMDPKERMREFEEIVRQVIVDTGTSEFNSAKIFVNEAVIRKKHLDEITSMIAIYRKAPVDSEDRYTLNDQDPTAGVYLSGSRNSTILKMYGIVAYSYLFDDKYGLDKNLSGEIRHGFFSNLMRARLEEHNLITELDDKGVYLPNFHWRERNPLIKDKYWKEFDDILKDFSRGFDSLISEAEEWMKINFQTLNSQRMFSFNLALDEIGHIKDVLTISDDSSYVVDFIISILSSKTDAALIAIRERLNGEFKSRIIELFEGTHQRLVVAKEGAALLDLMSALVRVRNEIQEDIHAATLWFYKSENPEISVGTLDKLVDIAVRSFEKVKGSAYLINLNTPTEFSWVPVNNRIGKPFILAIINLLDNCYAHSGLQQATQVSIDGDVSGKAATLTIANNLSDEKQSSLDQNAINEIHTKLSASDVSLHIRGEGGTGLIKASHEIGYLGQASKLSIKRLDDKFIASIIYDFSEVSS